MTNGRPRFSRQWLYTILILAVGAVPIYINLHKNQTRGDAVHLELKSLQVPGGWGYLILEDGHVFIRQTMIPAIPGTHPFQTRKDALAVGQKVIDRLSAGQMPVVTVADLNALGIRPGQPSGDSAQTK